MKKLIALLLALVMVVSLVACNTTKPENTNAPDTKPTAGKEDTKATEATEAPESETPLNIAWYSPNEITTHFDNPQWDMSLMIASEMVWERAAKWNNKDGVRIFTFAKSVTANDDFTVWTVDFNDGITWHDGEAVTVEDYLFSLYASVLNPSVGLTGDFKKVVGFQDFKDGVAEEWEGVVYDEAAGTVTFTLTESYWNFEAAICDVVMLPAHCFEGVSYAEMDTSDYFKKPIGFGAYMIDKVQMPDYFTLVRYDGYYGAKAGIKNVNVINYNNNADAMVTAIMNGDLDFVNRTAIADVQVADSIVAMNPGVVIAPNAGHSQRCWFFNLGERADGKMKEDLQKKEVRQAFDILMDQNAIADLVGAAATGTFVKASAPGYCPEYDRPYDVAAAKALLDAAGFDYTQTYDFAYYYNEQLVHDAHTLIVQLFAAAGVQVNPILLQGDLAALLYTDCNYDVVMLLAGGNDQSPANGYQKLTSSTSYTFMGKHEERGVAGGWDELYNKYSAEPDFAKRVEIGKEMQAKNYDECYMLSGYATALYSAWDASRVYIPEDQFIYGGNAYDFSQWKMLV